jgi:hypothetical protein
MAHLIEGPAGTLALHNPLLHLEVLGGVKLEGLDRMRVTLKVEIPDNPRPPLRHNLDLYNDTQLEKFIRKVAERLEVGTSVIAASLSELTAQLEGHRLGRIEATQEKKPVFTLSAEERQAAIEDLQQAGLQQRTLDDLHGTGILGEEKNVLILWYAMGSRKRHDPLSVICLAGSGTGKSYLMEKVAGCMPSEEIRENTAFTGASFYHFEREEIKGKVFLIEDLDGAQEVMFPIRELQTKKRISKTMTVKEKSGALKTVTLVVEGPVCVIGCTTREKVYEDNANRSLLIHLDGSKEQDARIMHYQKQRRAGLTDTTREVLLQAKLKRMQQVLEPVTVINPYAPLIDLPAEVFKPRRTLPLLLSFIEAITFYHQYQRQHQVDQQTGEVFIESTPEDVEAAFTLLEDVLFRKADELSGAARVFFQLLKNWDGQRSRATDPKQGGFFASMVRDELRIHPRTLGRYLNELCEFGLLEITGGNKYRGGYSYKVRDVKSYQGLQQSIQQQVQRVIEQVKACAEKRGSEAQAEQAQAEEVKVKRKPGRPKKKTGTEQEEAPRSELVEAEPDSTPPAGQ